MTSPAVVGLTGYAGSGKDTVAGMLATYGFKRVAFADPMKEILLDTDPWVHAGQYHRKLTDLVSEFGWDGAKRRHPDVRRLMQEFGMSCRRVLGEWTWTELALSRVETHLANGESVVVTDVRLENEARLITQQLDGMVWRVHRPDVGPVNGHVTEDQLAEYPVDRAVNNWGTIDDLRFEVQDLVEELFGLGYSGI